MLNSREWKQKDKSYHEDPGIVESFDFRIASKYKLEHKYFTLYKWIEEFKANKASVVLDFGCATGTASLALLRNGIQAVSLDASLRMIQRVYSKAQAESLDAIGLIGDAEQLPFKDQVFDGVVCMGVLHHLHDMIKGLEEQIRVLKKGGMIYIAEPYQHKPWVSYPYELLKLVAVFIRSIFIKDSLSTPERLITHAHIRTIEDFLKRNNLQYEIKYFVYWPYVFGILPECMAYPLVSLINKINGQSQRGDAVMISIKKNKNL